MALDAALTQLAERTEAAEREVEVLRHEAEAGRAAETEAMAAAARARDAVAAARLMTETLQLADARNQCAVAQERLRRTQAELATNPITPEGVGEARGRHRDCEEATARLVTATTRLDFRPLSGQRIRVAGRDVDPAQPFMVGRPVELELAGFGRLVVTPGGEDLAARQTALDAAQVALAAALAAIGCQTIGDAESGMERRREMEAERRRDETEIKAILQANGSRSVDALAQLCAQREAELANLRSRIPLGADLSDEASLTSDVASRAEALDRARAVLERSPPVGHGGAAAPCRGRSSPCRVAGRTPGFGGAAARTAGAASGGAGASGRRLAADGA